jgi:hypothetical protein
LADFTPGHIGQKNFAPAEGFTSASSAWQWQQDFFSAGGFMRFMLHPMTMFGQKNTHAKNPFVAMFGRH